MPDGIIDQLVRLQDKDGDNFRLSPSQSSQYHEVLAAQSPYFCVLDILDERGAKVGVANYYIEPDQSGTVYLNWVELSRAARDRGIALAIIEFANAYFPEQGMKKLVCVIETSGRQAFEALGFWVDETQESRYGRIQMAHIFD